MASFNIKNRGNDGRGLSTNIKSMNLIEKAFRDVSREEWAARIGGQEKVYLLEDHISNMKGLLSDLSYETYCADKLIDNTSRMGRDEAEKYMGRMESLAYFYSKTLSKDIARVIITGLVLRARDLESVEKYYNSMVYGLRAKALKRSKSVSIYEFRLNTLHAELKRENSGFFRLFKKKKIVALDNKARKLEAVCAKKQSELKKVDELISRIDTF